MDIDASRAIKVIDFVSEKLGAKYCAYLTFPNVVLTLSGARMIADGVFWHNNKNIRDQWRADINRLFPVLDEICPLFIHNVREEDNNGAKYVVYDISTHDGISNLASQTRFIDDSTELVNLSGDEFGSKIRSYIQKNAQFKDLSDEILGHISYGLLLGYPDKAIESMVDYWVNIEGKDKFASKPIGANILGADYYDCPQPIYQYQRNLVNDGEIQAHERLWSKVIKDFYTSGFFKKLEQNPEFSGQIKALIKY